jgi:hypothetical protein
MNDDVKMMWKRYIMFLVQCIQRFQHSNPMNNYAFSNLVYRLFPPDLRVLGDADFVLGDADFVLGVLGVLGDADFVLGVLGVMGARLIVFAKACPVCLHNSTGILQLGDRLVAVHSHARINFLAGLG